MIDLQGIKILLTSYTHYFSNISSCGLICQEDFLPNYCWKNNQRPDICKISCDNSKMEKSCSRFYKELPLGINSATCPLGIIIKYSKVKVISGTYAMIIHTNIDKQAAKKFFMQVNRKTKKEFKKNIFDKLDSNDYNNSADIILDNFSKILDTVLAGRLAESMRAITHEMLTPIQGVWNDVKLLKKQISENPEAVETVWYLEKNIDQILLLSKNIAILLNPELNISEQSARRITVHFEINNIWERYRSKVEEKKLELKHGRNKGGLYIEAVPDQFSVLINILLENAIKYSFAGFEDKPNKINVEYKDLKAYLEISIISLGCLIEPNEYDRIFELGYRGKNSNERFRNGTGSGLYIAKNIVKAHFGEISVSSVPVEVSNDAPLGNNKFILKLPYRFKNMKTNNLK